MIERFESVGQKSPERLLHEDPAHLIEALGELGRQLVRVRPGGRIDVAADTSFVYNQYIDLDEEAYNAYVDEVIRRSDVDSDASIRATSRSAL